MHLAQKISFGIRLWKDVGGAEANGVLIGTAAGVSGDGQEDRDLLQVLALTDRADRFIGIVGEGRLEWLPAERLLDPFDVPRLVLDNENVFRHVGSLRMG